MKPKVKQGAKKSRGTGKQGRSAAGKPVEIGRLLKRNKRKKPDKNTRIQAVMVAAIIILAALACTLTAVYIHSAKTGGEGLFSKTQLPAAPPTTAPPPSAPAAPATPQPPPGTLATPSAAPASSAAPPAAAPEQTPVKPGPLPVKPEPPTRPEPAPAKPAAPVKPEPPSPVKPEPATAEKAPALKTLPEPAQKPPQEQTPKPLSQGSGTVPPAASALKPPVERPAYKGSLAFVIDDAGNNLHDLEPFLKFPGALTIAVLPGLPNSAEAGRRIRAAGKEVFLHQPMESLGGTNPGPGAIRAGMSRDEIRAIVNRNLDEVWPVAGINNHEGSRVTMDQEAMETLISLCRERGIVFLDSRTTAETAAPRAARRLGVTIAERDVFVDNVQERVSMLGYINTGLAKAGQKGSAIMIGHVSTPSLAPLLAELYPDLNEQGYSFSSVSKLISGTSQ